MTGWDKRWHRRREAWVTPPDVFRPGRYAVDVVAEATARPFVEAHHYSGSFPAARLSVGLFGPGPELVGVAVFSVPMSQQVLPKWTGQAPDGAAELGRFVCAPSVRFNGESWFLARAFPLLVESKGVRAVVSFADPLERRCAAGELMKRQHWGTIYQASNALFAGRTHARTLIIARDGSVISDRMLSKVRAREKGWEYGVRQLVSLGASRPYPGEDLRGFVRRALAQPGFRRVRHPGNLAYVFGLDADAKRHAAELHAGGLAYPRRAA